MKKLLVAFAAAGTVLAVNPAVAGEVVVPYSDLNLASAKGQKIFERRVDAAARDVCGMDEQTTGTRIVRQETLACYRQARTSARERFAAIVADYQLGG